MTRYAIYFVPQFDTALWTFGCRAVGYDSSTGSDVAFHDHPFYRRGEIKAWTDDPRRYGCHATLKPPFELAEGTTIEALESTASAFASARSPFGVDRFRVKAIGSFLALTPAGASPDLEALAGDCIRTFEPFRASLSAADRERRLKSPLTERQIAHLDQWGYPYVFDEFRFHMTLTGRLPEDVKADALHALTELYAPIDRPVTFDSICVCEQADRQSRFRVRQRFGFGG